MNKKENLNKRIPRIKTELKELKRKKQKLRKNIRIYAGICAVTLLIALFWQSVWIRTILAYEILLLPFLRIQAGYLEKSLEVKLSVPVHGITRKQEFVIAVEIKNYSKMPMPAVPVRICCKNTFTEECIYIEETAMVGAGSTAELQFYLTAEHCGMIEAALEYAGVQDYMRLFTKGKQHQEEIMVLPPIHQVQMDWISHTLEEQEGNHYSPDENGEDTSEVFDIREYRAGDTLHKIHWKLSAKTDEFLVKEYSLPQDQDIRFFLDLYLDQEKKEKAVCQEQMDTFLEILASISWSMQKKHWYHSIIWWDEKEKQLREVKSTSEKETYEMLEMVYLSGFYEHRYDVEELYMERNGWYPGQARRQEEHGMHLSVDGSFSFDHTAERLFTVEQLDGDWNQWVQNM